VLTCGFNNTKFVLKHKDNFSGFDSQKVGTPGGIISPIVRSCGALFGPSTPFRSYPPKVSFSPASVLQARRLTSPIRAGPDF